MAAPVVRVPPGGEAAGVEDVAGDDGLGLGAGLGLELGLLLGLELGDGLLLPSSLLPLLLSDGELELISLITQRQ